MHPLDDPVLRPRKVADHLGVHYYTVIAWMHEGKFGPIIRLGTRAIGVRLSAAQKYLEERAPEAAKPLAAEPVRAEPVRALPPPGRKRQLRAPVQQTDATEAEGA